MIIDLFVQAKSRHKICCSTIYFVFENNKKNTTKLTDHSFIKKNPYEDLILLRNTSSRSFYLFTGNILLICFH